MLEEIRFLTNFRMDSYSPMSLILVGQTELLATLQRPSLLAISQRVSIRWNLLHFYVSERVRYIEHDLRIVGGNYASFH
jgi:general secretion pathway protein A